MGFLKDLPRVYTEAEYAALAALRSKPLSRASEFLEFLRTRHPRLLESLRLKTGREGQALIGWARETWRGTRDG